MDDIKDIRMPVEFPLWGWVLLGLLMIGIVVWIFRWLAKRQKPQLPKPAEEILRSPADVALEQLEALHQKQYPATGMFKEFYISLSDIVRHYLENQLGIRAPEMTTEEFLNFAHNSTLVTDAHKVFLKDFLNGCDMVKFAKHTPTANEAQHNFDLAKKLIKETSIESHNTNIERDSLNERSGHGI